MVADGTHEPGRTGGAAEDSAGNGVVLRADDLVAGYVPEVDILNGEHDAVRAGLVHLDTSSPCAVSIAVSPR